MKTDYLNVLLVDDEYLIRELLKKRIRWDDLGCKIVGEASCAAEVFDFLEERTVDLIITDINMPKTDGLEMSEKILESYSKIKIIVISGYDKFEYAKSGIKIGIEDYILKPIREEEVERAVLSVKEKLGREKEDEYETEKIRKQLESNLPYLREKLFIDLFKNRWSIEELQEKLRFLKLDLKEAPVQIALIQILFKAEKKYTEEERLIALMSTVHNVETYFKEYPLLHILVDQKENIAIFCNDSKINLIEECGYLLNNLCKHNANMEITIGISDAKRQIEGTKECYHEAVNALQFKAVLGGNQVICYSDLDIITDRTNQIDIIQENAMLELQFLIKAGLHEQAVEFVDLLYESIGRYAEFEEQNFAMHIRIQTSRMISALFYMTATMDIKFEDMADYEENFFKSIASITTIPQAKQLVLSLIKKLIDHINAVQGNMINDYMEDILEYIQKNMCDYGLTLNKIAAHFYMNPSYLSRVFKQKKGVSFKDYLNKIRMEKALEYIRNTDLKAYEIGEKIGIPDGNYFSTSFKKYMGMSVTDYKKKITNEI